MSDPTLRYERIEDSAPHALVYRLHGVLGETDRSYKFLDEIRAETGTTESPRSLIVFNLEDVEYMTSAGIGIIAACHTSARKADKALVLTGVRSAVAKVLDLTGVATMVPMFPDEKAALGS